MRCGPELAAIGLEIESIAGLWAYAETYGQPVSRLPGSPVARVALLVGRAVSGVYAKVMNFRSIDPRAAGEGMSGAGETDRFDALQARVVALESEIAKRPSLESCPICNSGNLKVTDVHAHPTLGAVGVQERTMKCDNPACGHTEKRIHDPVGHIGKK